MSELKHASHIIASTRSVCDVIPCNPY